MWFKIVSDGLTSECGGLMLDLYLADDSEEPGVHLLVIKRGFAKMGWVEKMSRRQPVFHLTWLVVSTPLNNISQSK